MASGLFGVQVPRKGLRVRIPCPPLENAFQVLQQTSFGDLATNFWMTWCETVPNEDKLFSIFEPHTQLYHRGKAG